MNELLEQVHFETVKVLSDALDARDRYTAGHSRRVMEYSAAGRTGRRFPVKRH